MKAAPRNRPRRAKRDGAQFRTVRTDSAETAVHRTAFELRKPDAMKTCLAAIERLRREATAPGRLALRKWLVLARRIEDLIRLAAGYKDLNPERDSDDGPTPETALKARAQRRGNPLIRMLKAGQIEGQHFARAMQIAEIHAATIRAGTARCHRWDNSGGGGAFEDIRMSERIAWKHGTVYLPWARAVGHEAVRLVLAVAVDGVSLRDLARAGRCRKERVVSDLRAALDRYDEIASVKEQRQAPPPSHAAAASA